MVWVLVKFKKLLTTRLKGGGGTRKISSQDRDEFVPVWSELLCCLHVLGGMKFHPGEFIPVSETGMRFRPRMKSAKKCM